MSTRSMTVSIGALLLSLYVAAAGAQLLPYGPSITLAEAEKAASAAAAEAQKNNWAMAIAVVDTGGNLVLLHKMDNTQIGSIHIAIRKAETAARFKRPSKVFQDLVAKGFETIYLMGLEGAMPVQGGIPVVKDGKIIGALGTSGATGAQDSQAAEAGIAALK